MSFENKHTVRRRTLRMPEVNRRCAHCGKHIDRNGEWMANGSGFFCSDACLMKSERDGRRKIKFTGRETPAGEPELDLGQEEQEREAKIAAWVERNPGKAG